MWNSPLQTFSFPLVSCREQHWRERQLTNEGSVVEDKSRYHGQLASNEASASAIQVTWCPCAFLSPWSWISAASNRFLPCMSASSTPSTHLNKSREDGTSQLVTWEWANFLCPCFEMNRKRRKKKIREVYTFNLGKNTTAREASVPWERAKSRDTEDGSASLRCCHSAPLGVAAGAKATFTGGHCTSCGLCQQAHTVKGDLFFCLLFALSPPWLPKTTLQAEFQGQSIWFFSSIGVFCDPAPVWSGVSGCIKTFPFLCAFPFCFGSRPA